LTFACCSGVSEVGCAEEPPPDVDPPEPDADPLPAPDAPDVALPLPEPDVPLGEVPALPPLELELLDEPLPVPVDDCPELELHAAAIIARTAIAEMNPDRWDRRFMWASSCLVDRKPRGTRR